MNERDIELAAQAGAHWEHGDWNLATFVHFCEDELQEFADLIRADEREACAKVAEQNWYEGVASVGKAIRARSGEQK